MTRKTPPQRPNLLEVLGSLSSPFFAAEGAELSRAEAFRSFLADLRSCDDCELRAGATQPVPGHGDLDAPLMMVGEAPGAEEDRSGIPFSGAAGHLLDRSLAKLGVRRSRIYITNVVRFRPLENRIPRAGEISACVHHLVDEIRIVRPRIIAALGVVAVNSLLGTRDGLKTFRGRYVDAGAIRIFPMFHPAYALRNIERDPSILAVFETDLRRVCDDAGLMAR